MGNKVILLGRLGSDPELTETATGKAVARFSLATSETYKGQTTVQWHKIVAWGKLAQMRRGGIVQAVNINPGGERAVWRYADRLEVVGDLDGELRWQGLKRRCGL